MTHYAAFLRGVNVGGVNLKMAEVAAALSAAGFSAVRTLLASGNVLLESPSDAGVVRGKAEAVLREKFGYDAWVLVYDIDTVRAIVDGYPFEPDRAAHQSYVTFVSDRAVFDELAALQAGPGEKISRGPTWRASSTGRSPRAPRWTAPSARPWVSRATSRRRLPATYAR
ncbi:hypothetical protein I553_9351 [Mycobacterium xenopi 4042]|uniref:Uncharacterized protein n=1 Tax=Mycobacterium xenopi 4042 TaxID=1299334 RepID=X8E036_MYCXE|nr:hypothetical protein I553_9351 [Mycobacterium xenopi 4042]